MLDQEMQKLRMAKISEQDLESVHSTYHRECLRASGAKVAWACATQNLPHNISVAMQTLGSDNVAAKAQLTWNYKRYKSILQKPGRPRWGQRRFRPRRMKNKAFKAELHRLGEHSLETWGGCSAPCTVRASVCQCRLFGIFLQTWFGSSRIVCRVFVQDSSLKVTGLLASRLTLLQLL